MPPLQYPLVNGSYWDYSSVKIKVGGKVYTAVKSVNFDDTVERGMLEGTSQLPLGKTPGKYKATASIEIGLEEHFNIIADLGDGYMNKFFDVEVQYSGTGLATHTVEIVGCNMDKLANAHTNSPDALTVSIDLSPMYLIRDGKKPVNFPGNQG